MSKYSVLIILLGVGNILPTFCNQSKNSHIFHVATIHNPSENKKMGMKDIFISMGIDQATSLIGDQTHAMLGCALSIISRYYLWDKEGLPELYMDSCQNKMQNSIEKQSDHLKKWYFSAMMAGCIRSLIEHYTGNTQRSYYSFAGTAGEIAAQAWVPALGQALKKDAASLESYKPFCENMVIIGKNIGKVALACAVEDNKKCIEYGARMVVEPLINNGLHCGLHLGTTIAPKEAIDLWNIIPDEMKKNALEIIPFIRTFLRKNISYTIAHQISTYVTQEDCVVIKRNQTNEC